MKISIAMATYNGALYLLPQLKSFVTQTRRPDEVIISDDGSTDETLDIIAMFSETAPFEVIVIRGQENLGYAGNFNRALEAATGDLVLLSDQDDVWFPEKLERLENFLKENPEAQVVLCDAALTDADLKPVGVTKIEQIRSAGLSLTSFVMGCCAAIRREFLELTLPIPVGFPAHDTWLVRIADGLKAKAVLEEPLQYYRRHGKNESNFIANELRPITKGYVLWRELIRAMQTRGVSKDNFIDAVECEKLLQWGVERAESRFGPDVGGQFAELREEMAHRIMLLENRLMIRRAPWFRRVPCALTMWRRGGYERFGGCKSLMRDIIFP